MREINCLFKGLEDNWHELAIMVNNTIMPLLNVRLVVILSESLNIISAMHYKSPNARQELAQNRPLACFNHKGFWEGVLVQVTRRDFIRWAVSSARELGISFPQLKKLNGILKSIDGPPVVWLRDPSCAGCSTPLLNISNYINHNEFIRDTGLDNRTLVNTAGELAIASLTGDKTTYNEQFILCVEGGVPTAANGKFSIIGEKDGAAWTMLNALNELSPKARYVLAVGSCAAYGSEVIPSGYTGVRSVQEVIGERTKTPVINLPDCPVDPTVVMGTIVMLLTRGLPQLDNEGRPLDYYANELLLKFSNHACA